MRDSPIEHPRITDVEKNYIVRNIEYDTRNRVICICYINVIVEFISEKMQCRQWDSIQKLLASYSKVLLRNFRRYQRGNQKP